MKRLLAVCVVFGIAVAFVTPAVAEDDKSSKETKTTTETTVQTVEPVKVTPEGGAEGTRVSFDRSPKDITVTGQIVVRAVMLVEENGDMVMIPYRPKNTGESSAEGAEDEALNPVNYLGKTVTISGRGWERINEKTGKRNVQLRSILSIKEATGKEDKKTEAPAPAPKQAPENKVAE